MTRYGLGWCVHAVYFKWFYFYVSEPHSITEGVFVWYKFRNYPFWPALVSGKTFVDHLFLMNTCLYDGFYIEQYTISY